MGDVRLMFSLKFSFKHLTFNPFPEYPTLNKYKC